MSLAKFQVSHINRTLAKLPFFEKKNQNFFFSELPNFWQKCQKTLKSKPRKISDQSH